MVIEVTAWIVSLADSLAFFPHYLLPASIIACSSTSSIAPRFSCPLRLSFVLQARNPGSMSHLEMTLVLLYNDSFLSWCLEITLGEHKVTFVHWQCTSMHRRNEILWVGSYFSGNLVPGGTNFRGVQIKLTVTVITITQCNTHIHFTWSTKPYCDSSCLYDSPVSIFAGTEVWSGKVPVDESKRGGIVGLSPLHPDDVASQDSETSLPHLHNRVRVWLRIILESSGTQYSEEQDQTHRFLKHGQWMVDTVVVTDRALAKHHHVMCRRPRLSEAGGGAGRGWGARDTVSVVSMVTTVNI